MAEIPDITYSKEPEGYAKGQRMPSTPLRDVLLYPCTASSCDAALSECVGGLLV